MNRKTREELNELSKKAFGTSSKWKKLIDQGVKEPYERQREVMVPHANGTISKKTFTDKKSVVRHYTVEEVKTLMEGLISMKNNNITPSLLTGSSAPSVQTLDSAFPPGSTVTLSDGTST